MPHLKNLTNGCHFLRSYWFGAHSERMPIWYRSSSGQRNGGECLAGVSPTLSKLVAEGCIPGVLPYKYVDNVAFAVDVCTPPMTVVQKDWFMALRGVYHHILIWATDECLSLLRYTGFKLHIMMNTPPQNETNNVNPDERLITCVPAAQNRRTYRKISNERRQIIINANRNGSSLKTIAEYENLPDSIIQNIVNKYLKTERFDN
ncbi:hypothetical protein RF11_01679 [Thelohanellus kitauei]|uniref:Uncharacterized protein n=1 Tax=Thelohanellus kitauei TaxID=669202 RepID=A0A0C2IYH7_THEKT|nr:hypothetical protein RF11_01679 [Thelohanellus kitauei]